MSKLEDVYKNKTSEQEPPDAGAVPLRFPALDLASYRGDVRRFPKWILRMTRPRLAA